MFLAGWCDELRSSAWIPKKKKAFSEGIIGGVDCLIGLLWKSYNLQSASKMLPEPGFNIKLHPSHRQNDTMKTFPKKRKIKSHCVSC